MKANKLNSNEPISKVQNFSSKLNRLFTYGYQVNINNGTPEHYKIFKSLKEAREFVSNNLEIVVK